MQNYEKNGETNQGVYIPRRDTNSLVVSTFGGKLFLSEHHKAVFEISENEILENPTQVSGDPLLKDFTLNLKEIWE